MLNMIFKGIKPFIHEVTLAKFRFVGDNYLEEFLKIMDVDKIPKDYGGEGPFLDETL